MLHNSWPMGISRYLRILSCAIRILRLCWAGYAYFPRESRSFHFLRSHAMGSERFTLPGRHSAALLSRESFVIARARVQKSFAFINPGARIAPKKSSTHHKPSSKHHPTATMRLQLIILTLVSHCLGAAILPRDNNTVVPEVVHIDPDSVTTEATRPGMVTNIRGTTAHQHD
jgi:hypothetical protein